MVGSIVVVAAAALLQQPACDLSALERWKEDGVAPGQIIATRPAGRGGSAPMSRPLCPHPQLARYIGSGSTDDAKNFGCVEP